VSLSEDVSRIAAAAAAHRAPGEHVEAVIATESAAGERIYLAAFATGDAERKWLALDHDGAPVTSRGCVREAASIAALVELAEDAAELATEEPRIASLQYLDSIGGDSSIAGAFPAVEELARDVEQHYKLELT
jgi:hypothetical protein